MNILISGGSGFLGHALTKSFISNDHKIFILTRDIKSQAVTGAQMIPWDAKTTSGWGHLVNDMDVIIHLAGKSLSTFPWTSSTKRSFRDSRVLSGKAITDAITQATRRPKILIQASGINYYGLSGSTADESTPPGGDFLAQLAVEWENATAPIEELGVRRIIVRTAPVLAKNGGLLSLMALPVKLFVGGPLGNGKFSVPWIHIHDWLGAIRHLIADESARGAYNLIAPAPTSNADFNRALASVLHRPYWFPTPAFLLRILLGEMSVLVVEGRFSRPKRLLESGYHFQFETARDAFEDLYK